jgi:hypothetical protein
VTLLEGDESFDAHIFRRPGEMAATASFQRDGSVLFNLLFDGPLEETAQDMRIGVIFVRRGPILLRG